MNLIPPGKAASIIEIKDPVVLAPKGTTCAFLPSRTWLNGCRGKTVISRAHPCQVEFEDRKHAGGIRKFRLRATAFARQANESLLSKQVPHLKVSSLRILWLRRLPPERSLKSRLFVGLVALGILLRLAFVLVANGQELTFHSGGSDAPTFVILAQNMLAHRGFSFAGEPSALAAPGYPLLVAGFMSVFGSHFILVIRLTQFILGLLTVGACCVIAFRLFGGRAAQATLVFGLFLPTLIFTTAQVLTECVAAFLTSLYFLFLVIDYDAPDVRTACGLGVTAGLCSLIRFNAAALPAFAGWSVFRNRAKGSFLLREAIVLLLPVLIIAPWLLRNEAAFHGRVLFSTQTGPNLVAGVIAPEGRTQPGDKEKWEAAVGWELSEVETNDPSRLALPSEVELNQQGIQAAPRLWKQQGSAAIPLLARKVAVFWLSLDQIADTGSFTLSDRLVRATGVMAYWVVLGLAIVGWLTLRARRTSIAYLLLVYALGMTAMHLPLVMNTRLRIPLMEPLLVFLSGAGWVTLFGKAVSGNDLATHETQAAQRGLRTAERARS